MIKSKINLEDIKSGPGNPIDLSKLDNRVKLAIEGCGNVSEMAYCLTEEFGDPYITPTGRHYLYEGGYVILDTVEESVKVTNIEVSGSPYKFDVSIKGNELERARIALHGTTSETEMQYNLTREFGEPLVSPNGLLMMFGNDVFFHPLEGKVEVVTRAGMRVFTLNGEWQA